MGLLDNEFFNYLPDDPNKKAAMRAGLLQFGASMLQGEGRLGGILGKSLAAGSKGYLEAGQQAQKGQMEAAQLRLLQNKDVRSQQQHSILRAAFPQAGDGEPQSENASPIAPGPEPRAQNVSHQQRNSAEMLPAPQARPYSGPGRQTAPEPLAFQRSESGGVAPIASLPRVQSGQPQFPLSLQQVAALKASGGPDLSSEYKMANEGFKREQGATYEMPNGERRSYAKLDNGQTQGEDGTITSAPGYNTTMAATEGAKADAIERAKAGYDLLPLGYVGEDDRPMGGTRGSYIARVQDLPRVGAPPRTPMKPGAPVTPANFPRVTPEEQQERDGGRLEILQQERAKATSAADVAAIDREIAGVGGGRARARGAPVLQSASEALTQRGAIETTQKAGQDLNSNWIKDVHNPVQLEGKSARTTLGQLETIKNIGLRTGWGTEAKAAAASFLGALGVKDAERFAGNAQKFQQVAMERNMTMLQAQAGPQTEGDSQRAQQTFVMLKNTPMANAFVVDLTGSNARIAAKKAAFYNEALPLAKASGDLTEIDRRWSRIAPSVWADPALARYKAK